MFSLTPTTLDSLIMLYLEAYGLQGRKEVLQMCEIFK